MLLLSKTAVQWCVSFCIWCARTPSQYNKNEEHPKGHSSFLVRWKGLEPPTYWFVASHSIQLSYQRICKRFSLAENTITHCTIKCKYFFTIQQLFFRIFSDKPFKYICRHFYKFTARTLFIILLCSLFGLRTVKSDF